MVQLNVDGLRVFFPFEKIYKEQYEYMCQLKQALDAPAHGVLEMPTGTGKTVTLLSLITSYQLAHPETTGKLIYCTRTVPEMTKCVEELKHVIKYRDGVLAAESASTGAPPAKLLAVCLSARRNMCINDEVVSSGGEGTSVDVACRSLTAEWVRAKASEGAGVRTCDFFEAFDQFGSGAELSGIYTLDDMKELGKKKGWCPYFLTRQLLSYANVIVFNYQYMLDPKVSGMVSRELDARSVVVFDEAHNIDNICVEAMSVSLDRQTLVMAAKNLRKLEICVKRMKESSTERLQLEYRRLVESLPPTTVAREDAAAAPVLPADAVQEVIPGNIRNADLFLRFMKQVVMYLKIKIQYGHYQVESSTPTAFQHGMSKTLHMDTKPLKFAYTRLNSLLRAVQVTDVDEFSPLQLVTDFVTLLSTYPQGFMVILEPYNPAAALHTARDPVLQLTCMDASIAAAPVFERFRSVILTSGTLSPLDMYPKMLRFRPGVSKSFNITLARQCICPVVVARGADQVALTTKFEKRGDDAVIQNYGALLLKMADVTPDGIVAFFPSYSYMTSIVTKWHSVGILNEIQKRKLVFIETKDIVETTLALSNFKAACSRGRGAIFLSVARGKVAEGIDFEHHFGRMVILFGIPFQYTLSHTLRARLVYLRDEFGIQEKDFLSFDAIRQASQCLGRVVRGKSDYGMMVLADSRYGRADKLSKMPQWISQYLRGDLLNMSIVEATQLARRFFHDMAKPMTARMESSIDMDLSRALYVPGPPVVEGPGVGGEGPGPLGVDGPSTALGGVGLGGSGSDVGALGPLAGAGGPGGGPLSSAGGGGSGLAAGLPQGDGSRADAPAAATSAFSLSAPAPPSKRLRLTTE